MYRSMNRLKRLWSRFRTHLKDSPSTALFLLAPTIGELLSGSAPPSEFFNPLAFTILALLYGCGALVCRDLVVRWGKGFWSLLLLAIAYGILEEGVVVRSFFDPNWVDLDQLGIYGREIGVNWVWTLHLTHYHALISVIASIYLVEMLYPDRRNESWLSKRGLRRCWAGLAFMVTIGPVLMPYNPPWLGYLACWITMAGLIWLARRIPHRAKTDSQVMIRAVPRPRRFFWLGWIGLFGYFYIVYASAEAKTLPYGLTMLILCGWDALALGLLWRWSGHGQAWDDRHRLALIAGGLWTFIALNLLMGVGQMVPVVLVAAYLLWRFGRRLRRELGGPPRIITV